MDSGHDALLVGREMQLDARIGMHFADILDGDLNFDAEAIIGHDVEDLLATLDDAADGEDIQPDDAAGVG